MPNVKDLNGAEQEGLQILLDKDETAWTEADKAHLRARFDYLSGDDKERLESVTAEGEEDEQTTAKPFSKMNKAELQAELTTRNIEYNAAATNPELVALLEETEANQ